MPKGKSAAEIIGDIIKASKKSDYDSSTLRSVIVVTLKNKGYSKSFIRKVLPHELKYYNRTNVRYRHT